MTIDTKDTKTIEKVGILLVHGIGETKKFENIEAVARNIATALGSKNFANTLGQNSPLDVRVIINTSDNAGFAANQQIWLADDEAPVIIEVKEYDSDDPSRDRVIKTTHLCFREAWWADLGKIDTLKSQLSFWKWGLSLWSREQYLGKKDKNNRERNQEESDFGVLDQVHLPTTVSDHTPKITPFDRLRFFVVSWIILLILPLLSFLSVILRQILDFDLRPDILVQYLGDIKHYQDDTREGAGYIIDIGQPIRVSIRRRMIKALVEMRLDNYDRWYVLAHSLGTVLAFNGLMEPDAALPNYLNEDLWDLCQKECKNSNDENCLKSTTPLTEQQADNIFPRRPAWLALDDIISRKVLFKNLKGLMTYGSPLSKFAVVWPAIVPINKDNSIFSEGFEWVNVYDPTDPVADRTKYFTLDDQDLEKAKLPVTEIAYKAESIHLLSHIEYLTYNPKRANPLVKQVAYWLLKGEKFQTPSRKSWGWPEGSQVTVYQSIRYLIWLIAGLLISQLLAFLVSEKLPDFLNWSLENLPDFLKAPIAQASPYLDLPVFANPLLYLLGAMVVVFLFGVAVRAIDMIQKSSGDNNR